MTPLFNVDMARAVSFTKDKTVSFLLGEVGVWGLRSPNIKYSYRIIAAKVMVEMAPRKI
jgi:hypothetical protein